MEPGACVLSETVTEDSLNCGRPLYGQTDSLSPGLVSEQRTRRALNTVHAVTVLSCIHTVEHWQERKD